MKGGGEGGSVEEKEGGGSVKRVNVFTSTKEEMNEKEENKSNRVRTTDAFS